MLFNLQMASTNSILPGMRKNFSDLTHLRNKSHDLEGRIHHARGRAVAAGHLANLLRPRRLGCGPADGLAVRGDHPGRGDPATKVERDECGLQLAKRRAFLPRAPRRRASLRALAGPLECEPAARSLRSGGSDLRGDRPPAGAPAD